MGTYYYKGSFSIYVEPLDTIPLNHVRELVKWM